MSFWDNVLENKSKLLTIGGVALVATLGLYTFINVGSIKTIKMNIQNNQQKYK